MKNSVYLNSKYFAPAIHIIVWSLLFVTLALVFSGTPRNNTDLPDQFFFYTNIWHVGIFYLNAYYLYPRFLNWKKWWLYIILILVVIHGTYYAKLYLLKLFVPSFELNHINDRIIFFPPIAFLVASTIFRLVANRIQFEKNEKTRKAERLSSELKFLRSQVSPHFLFNMMTNMVSLARQKSDLLEPSLIKLSEMLRYMLYEPNAEQFPLSKEISYLKNYIELQQLRFDDNVKLQLKINDEHSEYLIEPMLLVPFVENAFKHGMGMVKDPFITIELDVKGRQLFYHVVNNYNPDNLSKDKNSGIGLINVKERLNLLYPGKHRLTINDGNGVYEVKLNLDLS